MTRTTCALVHEGHLAAAGLVHRRVAGAAGGGARREDVARQLGALAGQRRREDLGRGRPAPPGRRSPARTMATTAALVEAQQLREAQVQAGRDARGDLQRRAGLPPLDLAEHRRGHAAARGEVAEAQVHRRRAALGCGARWARAARASSYECTLSRTTPVSDERLEASYKWPTAVAETRIPGARLSSQNCTALPRLCQYFASACRIVQFALQHRRQLPTGSACGRSF